MHLWKVPRPHKPGPQVCTPLATGVRLLQDRCLLLDVTVPQRLCGCSRAVFPRSRRAFLLRASPFSTCDPLLCSKPMWEGQRWLRGSTASAQKPYMGNPCRRRGAAPRVGAPALCISPVSTPASRRGGAGLCLLTAGGYFSRSLALEACDLKKPCHLPACSFVSVM